ncbi:hypothetical protein [Levilinea saccharolytica]|uniref:Uncharacterized protein n=1 Tax=Levilinea saccharolytica TaxID=229921 RepID=A0A0P6Y215_9CHLR|nr:hypothetical protein [Levilinea saccharolytica]KPL75696.1 hypothetical protein ADN01_17880 [Levilinea saccharolytica]GAP16639.1 hypothetical protein LSAC_00495 [Levilinea saccharolytica]
MIREDPKVHDLVNWVAGTKLIFILLLIVILATAPQTTLLWTGAAMLVSIASFFWRLFPLIRKMDRGGQIDPANYSAVLGWMIAGMMAVFLAALVIAVL